MLRLDDRRLDEGAEIRAQIENTTSDHDKEKLQERLTKLAGGVAVIKVGDSTEVEVKERKDRVDDALHATRAAVEEGIVPGGGTALLYASRLLDNMRGENEDQTRGIDIVRRALQAPLRQIAGYTTTCCSATSGGARSSPLATVAWFRHSADRDRQDRKAGRSCSIRPHRHGQNSSSWRRLRNMPPCPPPTRIILA